jgi:hypothetical protein
VSTVERKGDLSTRFRAAADVAERTRWGVLAGALDTAAAQLDRLPSDVVDEVERALLGEGSSGKEPAP